MPFGAVGAFDLVVLEQTVLERWRRDDVFEESLGRRKGAPEWVFHRPRTDALGIRHVSARLFKDLNRREPSPAQVREAARSS